jgi:hypothetical protein
MIVVDLALYACLLDHLHFGEYKPYLPWARSRNEKNPADALPEVDLVQPLRCIRAQKHAELDACPYSSHRRHRHYTVMPSCEVDLISIFVAQKKKEEGLLSPCDSH